MSTHSVHGESLRQRCQPRALDLRAEGGDSRSERQDSIAAQTRPLRSACATLGGALRAIVVIGIGVFRAELEMAVALVVAASRNVVATVAEAVVAANLRAAVGRAGPKRASILQAQGALLGSPILIDLLLLIKAVRAGSKRGHLIRIIPGAFLADSDVASGTGVDNARTALRARADRADE